jgi:hypothetical protein
MEITATINEGHNCLNISLAGDQSYLKIYDISGNLIRHSQTTGIVNISHMAASGDYKLESDGTITQVTSSYVELPVI